VSYANYATNKYVSQDDLVTANLDLVKRIAHHLAARLPASIDINDLLQAGMIGLLEASGNFDATRGASFETYAGIRIRGAMLDEVRRLDWTPRSVHQKYRQVCEAVRTVEVETGRPAESQAVADRLGLSIEDYHAVLADAAGCRLFSFEESQEDPLQGREIPSASTPTPDQALDVQQFRDRLAAAISRLPERERLVLSLYYERELNLKEIGAVLGVSESRVCQIHGQALIRLRAIAAD